MPEETNEDVLTAPPDGGQPPEGGSPEGGAPEGGQQQEQQLPPLEAPSAWSAEHQELFGKHPRDVQQFMLDRMKEFDEQHTSRMNELAPMHSALAHWAPYLQQLGVDPVRTFSELMPMFYTLRAGTNQQKVQLMMQVARDFGVDFGGPPEPDAKDDPFGFTKMLNQRLGPIERHLERLGGGLQGMQGTHHQAQVDQLQRQIEAFAMEKDDKGKPKHPYFFEVGEQLQMMTRARVASGQPVNLPEMYEQACWAVPAVRSKLQLAERKTAEAEAERKRKAAAAKGGLDGGGGGKPPADTPADNWNDAVRAVHSELAGA